MASKFTRKRKNNSDTVQNARADAAHNSDTGQFSRTDIKDIKRLARTQKPPNGHNDLLTPEVFRDVLQQVRAKNKLRSVNGGRTPLLTPKIQAKLIEAIKAGNYYKVACTYAGISYDTFKLYMRRGEEEIQLIDNYVNNRENNTTHNHNGAQAHQNNNNNRPKFTRKHNNSKGADNLPARLEANNTNTTNNTIDANHDNNNIKGNNGQRNLLELPVPRHSDVLPGEMSFAMFYIAIKKAEAEAEVGLVQQWQRLLPTDWKAIATFLERRHPEKWGRRQAVELTGKGGGPVDLQSRHLIIQQIIQDPENRGVISDQWRQQQQARINGGSD